jgi:succinyl-diaminopimelate desuccinylase
VSVVGSRRGTEAGPVVHLNGHIDVVPAGDGWAVDPFGGAVRDGQPHADALDRFRSEHRGGEAGLYVAYPATVDGHD